MSDGKEKETTTQVIEEDDDFTFGKAEEGGEGSGDEGSGKDGGEKAAGKKEEDGSEEGAGAAGEGKEAGKDGEGAGAADGSGEGGEGSGKEGAAEGAGEKGGESGKTGEDGAGEGGAASKEGAAGEGGEGGEGAGEKATDFFAEDLGEGGAGQEDKGVDVKSFAMAFEVEAETQEELQTKLTEKIESAKKEVKLDGYTPDAQSIIKHLNDNDGKIEEFFENKTITSLQSVVGLDPDKKVLSVRTNELISSGLKPEQAAVQAKEEVEELGTRQLKDMADQIDTDAKGLISQEVKKIVGDRELIASQERVKGEAKTKAEIDNLKNFVNTQENFMGIELTPKAKAGIVREIESGAFDEIANKTPESSKFAAYMIAKFGSKILENYSNSASEQNRKGHNAAIEKSTSALHKTKEGAQTKKTGKQAQESGESKNFDSWADDSAFGEDDE